jgi:hypothetical protein
MAIIDEETGEIRGWVECKTSPHLNDRAVSQLEPQGFQRSFSIALRILTGISDEDLKNCGLNALAEIKQKLGFAQNLSLILAVPRNPRFNLSKNGTVYSEQDALKYDLLPVRFEDGRRISPEIRERVLRALENYTIKVSPFTVQDIDYINQYLFQRLKSND